MGTKCNIIVKGSDTKVVRLADGYPEGRNGVLALLKPIVKSFLTDRGYLDEPYMMAHIAHRCIESINRERRKRPPGTADHLKGPDLINVRVESFTGTFSPDAEYLYRIVKDYTLDRGDNGAAIEVYQRNSKSDRPVLNHIDFRLIRKMPV